MKTSTAYSKCDCLRVLFFNNSGQFRADLADVVANYALKHIKSSKRYQDQSFIELLRLSQKLSPKIKNGSLFCVPFDNYEGDTQNELVHLSPED
jgi:hypothetical protein